MCINTKYSMSIIEKVFKYEETELPIIKYKAQNQTERNGPCKIQTELIVLVENRPSKKK